MDRADHSRKSTREAIRQVMTLTIVIATMALLLLPLAMAKSGLAGMGELAVAAGICLVAGWASELIGFAVAGFAGPVGSLMAGMAVRMLPPLAACALLAAQGANGRQYLAFICYLLTFYLVTLAVETWSAVRRVARESSPSNNGA